MTAYSLSPDKSALSKPLSLPDLDTSCHGDMSAATLIASPMKRHMSLTDSSLKSSLSSIATFIYHDCATASTFDNCAASEWNAHVSWWSIDAKSVSEYMAHKNISTPTTSLSLSSTGSTRTGIPSAVQTPTTAMPTDSGTSTTDRTGQPPTSITSDSTLRAPGSTTFEMSKSSESVLGVNGSSVPPEMNGTPMNAPSSSDPTTTSTSPSLSKLSPATTSNVAASVVRDSSSNSNHTGEIVGIVLAGLALFTLLGAITVYLRIRGRRRRAQLLAPSAEFLKIARERSGTPAGVMNNDGEADRSEPGTLTSRDFIALGRESPIADEELPPFTEGGYRDPVFEKVQASEEMRQWHLRT